ncbi:hypothetical protein BCR35DRAFT_324374 [Leucosporidium creatinivorum]|uniref:Crossover junction endonuclease MUS81 n=1 Tax=Leucosporidium creatinivorum TaxID=106004 RepID=A0A1Y2FVL2_9BASI|nr:hypothetical protein BCR35DRAFT_324374 [Leucosporidium creatinivorum]
MAPRVQPGNPQWMEWIEDVARAHEEKGSKAAQAYKKAARSLGKCPITFSHPDQAQSLDGVGAAVIKILTGKLKEHCERTGEPFPERVGPPKKATAKKRKKGPTSDEEREEEAIRDARRQRTLGGGGPVPAGAAAVLPTSDASPPAKRKTKSYVPRKRSGAYAILLGLYKNATYDDHQIWTLKAKIIQDATPYSDNSFDKPSAVHNGGNDPGGGHYTAWSGSKTLLEKDLIMTDNKRPIKYALTEEGYRLAEGLCSSAGVAVHIPNLSSGGASYQRRDSGYGASGSGSRRGSGPVAGRFSPPALDDDGDDDFRKEMEKAMRLSRLESQSSGGAAPYHSRAGPSGHQRPPIALPKPLPLERPRHPSSGSSSVAQRTSGALLDGRKAASGHYAARAPPAIAGPVAGNIDSAFAYYYLDINDERVLNRDDAEVSQEDTTLNTIYRIEYRSRQDLHKMAAGVLRKSTLVRAVPLPGGSTMSGYIRERVSNATAPGFPDAAASKAAEPPSDSMADLLAGFRPPKKVAKDAMYAAPSDVRRLGSDSTSQGYGSASLLAAEKREAEARAAKAYAAHVAATKAAEQPERARTGSSSGFDSPQLAPVRAREAPATSNFRPAPLPSTSTSKTPAARPAPRPSTSNLLKPPSPAQHLAARPLSRTTSSQNPLAASLDFTDALGPLVNRHPLDPVRDHVSTTNFIPRPFEAEILRPGSFKVVLIVDTREIGTSKSKRTEMIDELTKVGVEVDRKMLPLGDMLWVARRVDASGRPTGKDDVVLDAIVERKRLDDLCTSIKDGRYTEQKQRLRNSAITDRIYLIEKYDSEAQYSQFGKAIWTCKSQLQVNDGFSVHESVNFKDTISFLRMRTDIFKERYEKSDIHLIPDSIIERPTYLSLQKHLRSTRPSQSFLTSYTIFEALNRTSAAQTLKQTWATCMQKVSGLSTEKTVQFVSRWECSAEFWEGTRVHRGKLGDENLAMELEEQEAREMGVKRKAGKKRKVEDYVVEELGDGGPRGIKGKLGAKIYQLFAQTGRYVDA